MFSINVLTLRMKDFLRREDGSLAIEAAVILPIMFTTYLSVFSFFDAFRQYDVNQKAAYTIGDMVSRQTTPLDNAYLNGTQAFFDYLARSTSPSKIRISSIYYDADTDKYVRAWSKTKGSVEPLTNDDVKDWHDRLPVLPDQEHVTLVETWTDFDPLFDVGLTQDVISNFVFTRPRYAPRVCWETCS
ncbi:MAG: hypothetical protein WBC93_05730 [Sulfitobacter sp.]